MTVRTYAIGMAVGATATIALGLFALGVNFGLGDWNVFVVGSILVASGLKLFAVGSLGIAERFHNKAMDVRMQGEVKKRLPTTVVLVGTGAVAGAWPPVVRALRTTVSPEITDTGDLANLEMARVVHLLRFLHGRPESEREYEKLKEGVRGMRLAIARELGEAEKRGQLSARPEFVSTLESIVQNDRRTLVITTNWDNALDRAVAGITADVRVFHLHGSIDNPETLYLPTEISTEGYRIGPHKKHHARTSRFLIDAVTNAEHLIVYGLSLSPLDAELCQFLWVGRKDQPRLKTASVIDPEPEPVAQRLALVIGLDGLPLQGVARRQPGG